MKNKNQLCRFKLHFNYKILKFRVILLKLALHCYKQLVAYAAVLKTCLLYVLNVLLLSELMPTQTKIE